MRLISLASSFWFLITAAIAFAGDDEPTPDDIKKTLIKDVDAKKKLLGKRGLSLQWIEASKGTVDVVEEKERLIIKGEHRDSKTGDYLEILGVIETIDAQSFTFVGEVKTRVSFIAGGEPCSNTGRKTFRITGKRTYWRMKENQNACADVADYVDVHF